MTDDQKQKKVSKLIRKYAEYLKLHEWEIKYSLEKEDANDGAAAEIQIQRDYKRAHIYFYQCAFEKHSDIQHIVAHELCHILVDELYYCAIDILNGKFHTPDSLHEKREHLVEKLARLVK